MSLTNEKLALLRAEMKKENIDAYLIFSSDDHQSEYVADHFRSRAWISGFTGSAGTVVVTKNKACLWTDSRYFIQAEKQTTDSEFQFFKAGNPNVLTYLEWLSENIQKNQTVGFNGKTVSTLQFENLSNKFAAKKLNYSTKFDLIDRIWNDRPSLPTESIFEHEIRFAGESRLEKQDRVRKYIKEQNADCLLLAKLDDIAWFLNLRGGDIDCNPLFLSYLYVCENKTILFVDSNKFPAELKNKIANEITIADYSSVFEMLAKQEDKKIILNKATCSIELFNSVKDKCEIIDKVNVTTNFKTIKNKVEIYGVKSAHIQDGVAIVKFLLWLEKQKQNKATITEVQIADRLTKFRSEREFYHDISFNSIAAYGSNGAMCHYTATKENQSVVEYKSLFLLDSGGQYLNGTTDITRTIAMGDLTDEEMLDYTLVLKGHIGLARVKFPKGTTGCHIDVLARQHLWEYGFNYGHGTGHGVGFFSNVHEGPQNISGGFNTVALKPGMLTSNEPGIYREGKHGVRIENLILVEDNMTSEFGDFYKFKTVTLAPIDLKPVKVDLLSADEKDWLNNYHAEVKEKISPFLNDEEKAFLIKITPEV